MEESQHFFALDNWFSTPQGQDVALAFADELHSFSLNLQGKYLLQLGHCGKNAWWDRFHCSAKWILSPERVCRKRSIVGSVMAMPLERESIDCIIAPLTMEISYSKFNLLDEVDRVLKPMGYLVVLGVNPWSLWGWSLRWGDLSCFAHLSSHFSSSLSLKHAMVARGYQQCWISSFYYLPPVNSQYWLQKLAFLNQMGKMVCPYPAGFYGLILQKQDPCMTLLSCTLSRDWHMAHVNGT